MSSAWWKTPKAFTRLTRSTKPASGQRPIISSRPRMAFAKTSSAIRPPKNPLAPVQRVIHHFPCFTPDRRGKTTEHKDRPDILRDRAALDSPLRHCRLILETETEIGTRKAGSPGALVAGHRGTRAIGV